MKLIIKSAILFICSVSLAQTNLIDTSSWFEGNGPVSGFSTSGADQENVREMGIGPHNASVLLWKTIPNTIGHAGGWHTDLINIEHTKTYRFTVWVKKLNSNDGNNVFQGSAQNNLGDSAYNTLNGSSTTNSFFQGDLPTLDTWYLLVGYMHESGYTNTISIGGVYNGLTGVKIFDCIDYKFQTTATQIKQDVYLANNTNTSDTEFFYGPTMYEVNGQEPSIQDIINAQPDSQKPSKPILSSASKTDTAVDLSWTAATDNIGVTGYQVYKGGVLEATLGNVLNYQVTGLTASTPYSFTVTALDAAGNESINSNTISVTTNTSSGEGTGLGYWSLNNQNVYYTDGNVGIGTSIPDSKLTVKGSIHSEEVKVDLSVPAPDYVFNTDYELTPLEILQQYIKENNHLPNIPTAKDMEANGVELGAMNMKLLEKIEELTLYILQQQKELKSQSEENKTIENNLNALEKLIKTK